jgi:hypothetical protein
MKTCDEVLRDIASLKGIVLRSIQPGAELEVCDVDFNSKRVNVRASDGKVSGRPFDEFRKIWDVLTSSGFVHVESALRGSGSRRNQPETIMAALPYIEWGRIEGKKHLFLVEGGYKPAGELKAIDPHLQRELISGQGNIPLISEAPTFVVIADSVADFFNCFEGLEHREGLTQGLYAVRVQGVVGWVGDTSSFPGVACGTYLVAGAGPNICPTDLKLKAAGGVPYLKLERAV